MFQKNRTQTEYGMLSGGEKKMGVNLNQIKSIGLGSSDVSLLYEITQIENDNKEALIFRIIKLFHPELADAIYQSASQIPIGQNVNLWVLHNYMGDRSAGPSEVVSLTQKAQTDESTATIIQTFALGSQDGQKKVSGSLVINLGGKNTLPVLFIEGPNSIFLVPM